MHSRAIVLAAVQALILAAGAAADPLADRGRAVFEQHQGALITVRSAVTCAAPEKERTIENTSTAVVIDPSGLAIQALSSIDPLVLIRRSQPQDVPECKVVILEFVLDDGTTLPAELALRDQDLDLAFVRPVNPPAAALPFVDLAQSATPQLLDPLVVLFRLGEVNRRRASVVLSRVTALIDKPSLYYVLEDEASSKPVFTLEGAFVGIGAVRSLGGENRQEFQQNTQAIVVPAAQIAESRAQLPPPGAPSVEVPLGAMPGEPGGSAPEPPRPIAAP